MTKRTRSRLRESFVEYRIAHRDPLFSAWERPAMLVDALFRSLRTRSVRLEDISWESSPSSAAENRITVKLLGGGVAERGHREYQLPRPRSRCGTRQGVVRDGERSPRRYSSGDPPGGREPYRRTRNAPDAFGREGRRHCPASLFAWDTRRLGGERRGPRLLGVRRGLDLACRSFGRPPRFTFLEPQPHVAGRRSLRTDRKDCESRSGAGP